ncbi:MAG: rane protein [Acidimicrobiaceae bacterium]|nr:rane protein [Acidimicrobiaceae bacterium]
MSEPISVGDVVDGARLLALGLRPKQIPSRDLVYAELVKRATEDDAFRDLTEAIAEGLGLIVLAISPRTGVVLGPTDDSVFEQKFDDYARRATFGERRDLERVLHGVAHLAIAALGFPRPDDLANETYVGRVSVEQVDTVVREACTMLAARAAEAEEAGDPLEDAPELERVWRVYSRRPEATRTKDGRLAPSTTRGVIGKALRFLVEQGFLVKMSDADGGTYRTTPRFQVQVRELAAERAFAELLALQVITVTDPSGSLHTASGADGRFSDV